MTLVILLAGAAAIAYVSFMIFMDGPIYYGLMKLIAAILTTGSLMALADGTAIAGAGVGLGVIIFMVAVRWQAETRMHDARVKAELEPTTERAAESTPV